MGTGYEFAKAVESIAAGAGCGIEAVLGMTPRQAGALLQLRARRAMAERAEMMRAIRVAMHGDDKTFAKMIKRLEDEGQ